MTYINVFTCEPADQDKLVETLRRETLAAVRDVPGFVSANLHCSVDGCRVVNYAQWSDLGAFHALLRSERGRRLVEAVRRHATGVDVHVYTVDSVLSTDGGG